MPSQVGWHHGNTTLLLVHTPYSRVQVPDTTSNRYCCAGCKTLFFACSTEQKLQKLCAVSGGESCKTWQITKLRLQPWVALYTVAAVHAT